MKRLFSSSKQSMKENGYPMDWDLKWFFFKITLIGGGLGAFTLFTENIFNIVEDQIDELSETAIFRK